MKKTRLLPFVLCLGFMAACQSSQISNLMTAPGEPYFQTDFSTATGEFPATTLPEGSYAFIDGEYHLSVITPAFQLWALSGGSY